MKKKRIVLRTIGLLSVLLQLILLDVYAQTGPGGVGNSDGSGGQPANIIWLDASSLSLTDGDNVTTWTDLSGNGNDLVQATSTLTPYFMDNGTDNLNGNPIVRFSQDNNRILINPFNDMPTSGITTIIVFKSSETGFNGLVSYAEGWTYNEFLISEISSLTTWVEDGAQDGNVDFSDGNWHMMSHKWESSSGDLSINQNGDEEYSTTAFRQGRTLETGGSFVLGNDQDDVDGGYDDTQDFDGDIAEVIIFNSSINVAQTRIIENYLSAKYNLSFTTASNDKYTGNGASFIYDVAGIGQESDGDHTQTESGGLYLYERNTTLANGEYVMLGHDNSANNSSTIYTGVDLPVGTEASWARSWYIEKTSSDGIDVKLIFDFVESLADGEYPSNVSNYVLLYRANTGVAYTKVTVDDQGINDADQVYFDVSNANLLDGYYTIGTDDQTNSPAEGDAGRTWYALASGDWDTWEFWTLDPSGALPNNPSNEIPGASDNVVIHTGKTITISTNTKTVRSVTVEGILDLGTTTGHNFTEINGNGRIRISGDNANFPAGDATHFVTEGQGEGTVVFQGGSYNLSSAQTFFNVEVELDNPANVLTILNDITLNGSLTVNSGNLRVNNTGTDVLTVDIADDVTVESNGQISVGTGDTYWTHGLYHQFIIKGNFTNNGTVRFTNRGAADYWNYDDTGAAEVIFNNSSENQTIQCNGTTVFNQLTCDKGTDATYILEVNASNTANFALYGFNDGQVTGDVDGGDRDGEKALRLLAGTLKLGSNIVISDISVDWSYDIDTDARLWLDNNAIIGCSGDYVAVYGELRLDGNSEFTDASSEGVIIRKQGTVNVAGGTHNVEGLTTSTWGGAGDQIGAYVQSGGTFYVNDERADDYAPFHLPYQNNVFQMSGGELIINDQGNGGAGDDFALIINAKEGNYNVTGGTVIINRIYNLDYKINTRAPLWNLILRNSNGNAGDFYIDEYIENPFWEPSDVFDDCEDMTAQPLVVLNDLTLEGANGLTFITNNTDVSVGGDFILESGATYDHGNNTTYFIEDKDSYIYADDNTTPAPLTFNHVVIEKDQKTNPDEFYTVYLGETAASARTTDPSNANNVAIDIDSNLTITRGGFNTYSYKANIQGNIEIVDGQITAAASNPGRIVLNGTNQQTIKGSYIEEQEFGSFELDNTNGVKLLSDINVTNFTLTPNAGNALVDLDIYNLYVSGDLLLPSGSYSNTVMYKTAGNAGDGGITILWDLSVGGAGTTLTFPLGSGTQYTPAVITQGSTIADDGEITINPVDDYHPALKAGEESKTIPYYWVVDTADFSTVVYTDLQYTFTYPGTIPGGVKKGTVLWDQDWLWYDMGNVESGGDLIFPNTSYLTTEFALGNPSIFKTPEVYYSSTAGRGNDTDFGNNDIWTDPTCWSTEGHYSTTNSGDYPQAGDIAIIGFGLDNSTDVTDDVQRSHWFFVDADVDVGKVVFADAVVNADGVSVPRSSSYQPQLIINDDAALDFIAGTVSGNGTFNVEVGCSTCDADPSVTVPVTANIDADFSDFANNSSSRFDYDLYLSNNTAAYLPTSFPDIYPNLMIKGQNGTNRKLIIPEDILVKGNLTIRENATLLLSDTQYGDITVLGNMNFTINAGDDKLQFPTSGYERTFTLYGDILMEDGDADEITVLNTTPSGLTHTFRLGGSIDKQSGNTIDLWSDNSGGNNVVLELFGSSSETYTSDDNPMQLYRLEMNKEGSVSTRFDFDADFDIEGPTNGDTKALELIGGTLGLNDVAIDIDLATGGADFNIPKETSLEVIQGTVHVSGDDVGIALSGKLLIAGGTVDMDDPNYPATTNGNNYIEYYASGKSEIQVTGGSLTVGSQIRRPLTSSTSILRYIQSGGTVSVGVNDNPEGARGVFEVVNTGSAFKFSGGDFYISNAQTAPSMAALYLDADTLELTPGVTINIGDANTEANQVIGIYSTVNVENLTINNTSSNGPEAKMWTIPLSVNGDLTIESGAELDANGLTLNLYGDFINSGTFTPNQNTTYFKGTSDQAITGNTTFYNFVNQNTANLNLTAASSDIVTNDFTNQVGCTINDNSNDIYVEGDIDMSGTHIYGGSGDGITLNGASQQELTGDGIFGKLTIDNYNDISIPVGNEIAINDYLKLVSGVIDIGGNLLTLNSNCVIQEANPFGDNNMIQTNVSFTDNGVKKIFPSGAYNFTYPLGSGGQYTPVEVDITSNGVAGAYLVAKGANEVHPSIQDDAEAPDTEIVDADNVLQYYWVLTANGFTNMSATVEMYYDPTDVAVTAPYTVNDYITAKILNDGTGNWSKYDDVTKFDEANEKLIFDLSSAADVDITGDYTAGVDGSTFNGAIPDQVPLYQSSGAGGVLDWHTASTWRVDDGTGTWVLPATLGLPDLPKGSRVRILAGDIVETSANYISAYTLELNGTLDVGTTFGNRAGVVSGTGTLYTERGTLPAGYYEAFFSASGGTIEFGGSTDYSVLSNVTQVNNLTFSGTGLRELPNLELTVLGNMLISDEGTSSPDVVNEFDENLVVGGNITFDAGTFDAGIGTSTVTMNGSVAQSIGGNLAFTGTNAFWNFEVDNANGVTLNTAVDIDKNLTLTSGVIVTDATNILTIENVSQTAVTGYNSSNYIDGPLRKLVNSGGDFVFPVGDAGRYGPINIYNTTNASSAYWEAEYFNTGHANSSVTGSLVEVSATEYWSVLNPTAGDAAEVELRWDSSSDITPITTGNINDILVAEFNGTNWEDKASDAPSGGDYAGTVKTTAAINIDPQYYTLGATTTLLAQAYFTTLDDVCQGNTISVSFSGVDASNLDYSITYEVDGTPTTEAITSLPYSITATTAGTYVLTDFSYNNPPGHAGPSVAGTVNAASVTVNAAPAQPTITPIDGDPSLTFCTGGSVILTSSAATGYLWSTGETTQNINVNTSGNYTVQIYDANGCYSTTSAAKTVTVNALPIFVPSAVPASICFGETSQLDANFNDGSTTYTWSPSGELDASNIQNPVYTPTTNPTSPTQITTTFSVTVTDSNSCSDVGTVDVELTRTPETGPQYHIENVWGN